MENRWGRKKKSEQFEYRLRWDDVGVRAWRIARCGLQRGKAMGDRFDENRRRCR